MIRFKVKRLDRIMRDLGKQEVDRRIKEGIKEVAHTFYLKHLYPYPPEGPGNHPDERRGYFYQRHSGMFRLYKKGREGIPPGWHRISVSGKVQNAWKLRSEKAGLRWVIENVAIAKGVELPGRKPHPPKAYAVYLYERVGKHMRRIGWKPYKEHWEDFRKTQEHAKIMFRRILAGVGKDKTS